MFELIAPDGWHILREGGITAAMLAAATRG